MDEQDLSLELVTKIQGDGTTNQVVYSPEALEVLQAKPQLSAWGWEQGRPIYHRLPMVSEAYQKSYDVDQAMVYLDPTIPIATGPKTLECFKSERDWRVLEVMDGTISWRYGEFDVERRRVDLMQFNSGFGLQDGEYQVGYILTHIDEDPGESRFPGFMLTNAVKSNLSKIQIAYDGSGETVEHRKPYAVDDYDETTWWPNQYYGAEGYTAGTHFTLDFLDEVQAIEFVVEGEQGKSTSSCALYESDDAIVWYKSDQVQAVDSTWTLRSETTERRYRRFHFWDGLASIKSFSYTGQGYFRDRRVLFGDSRATFYIQNLYEAIEKEHILLAHFTVKGGAITNLVDHRRVTYEKYQPVADWVTTFHDEQLRCNFDHVVYYSEQYLSPESADFHLYNEMDDEICTGIGEVTLDDQIEVPVIRYPNVVGLEPDTSIDASVIEFVTPPESDGDLATMQYAEQTLTYSWGIDNGNY